MDYEQQVAFLQAIVDQLIHNGERVRIFFGDIRTGKDHLCGYDGLGYLRYATGADGAPNVVLTPHKTSRRINVVDYWNIVKITKADNGQVLYEHPNYHCGVFTIHEPLMRIKDPGYEVCCDGAEIMTFATVAEAERFIDFMLGKRNTK